MKIPSPKRNRFNMFAVKRFSIVWPLQGIVMFENTTRFKSPSKSSKRKNDFKCLTFYLSKQIWRFVVSKVDSFLSPDDQNMVIETHSVCDIQFVTYSNKQYFCQHWSVKATFSPAMLKDVWYHEHRGVNYRRWFHTIWILHITWYNIQQSFCYWLWILNAWSSKTLAC